MKRHNGVPVACAFSVVLAIAACGSVASEPQPQAAQTSATPVARSTAAEAPRPVPTNGKPVTDAADFDPEHFSRPTVVTNPYFPLTPGTELTWEGHAYDDGDRVSRKITMTVTDMTKVVDGVRTVVGWDKDYTGGELEELELTFYAQDDAGTVWYFGEYSEEYDEKTIVKSPVWLGGLHKARPGIMMQPDPRPGNPDYAEGWGGSKVNWTDRGKVDQVGVSECVPVDCYTGVVVVDEFNPDEPGTHQLKHYAPHVGGIRTGWRGAKEVEREELQLVSLKRLGAEKMAKVREGVLKEESRAYGRSPDVYGKTAPMRRG